MCGRISQSRRKREYAAAMGWDVSNEHAWIGDGTFRWNLPPGTGAWMMHRLYQGIPKFDGVHWGYRPAWAVEQKRRMDTNARIETAATAPYFRHMWAKGRGIIPADGWYEWTGEKNNRLPWFIRLKSGEPAFLAAISNYVPYKEGPPGSGFVIVTAAADAGMVDVHDRRPVVLAPADAELWMDPATTPEMADQIARNCSLPADAFEWYRVTPEVNKATNNERHFIERLEG